MNNINDSYIRTLTDMGDFLKYLVSLYGKELYKDKQHLCNLIADLYKGEERQKKLFRRAILEDNLARRVYELAQKGLSERKALADAIAYRFAENNYLANEIGEKVTSAFIKGINLLVEVSWKQLDNGDWMDNQGCIYNNDKTILLKGNRNLKVIFVANGVKKIDSYAFFSCTRLMSVELPASLYSIGQHSFECCKSLSNIVFHNGIEKIDTAAFYNCISLQKIQLPPTVREISLLAFGNCISLNEIHLPRIIKKIQKWTFQNCISLKKVVCHGQLSSIDAFAFNNCCQLEYININQSTHIGMESFGGCLMLNNY